MIVALISVAMGLAAIWSGGFPPLVDFAQHMAQSAYLLANWRGGSAAVPDVLCATSFRPYHLIHYFTAVLLYLFPVWVAAAAVLSTAFLIYATSFWAAIRAFNASRFMFPLGLVFFFGAVFSLGFIQNIFGLALLPGCLALAGLAHSKQYPGYAKLLMVLLAVTIMIHPVSGMMAGLSVFVILAFSPRDIRIPFSRIVIIGAPGLAAMLLVTWIEGGQGPHPLGWWDLTPSIWEKILELPDHAAGLFLPVLPERLLVISIGIACLLLAIFSSRSPQLSFRKPLAAISLLGFGLYLILPFCFNQLLIHTYARVVPLIIIPLLLMIPDVPLHGFRKRIMAVAVVSALLYLALNISNHLDWRNHVNGLQEISKHLPKGASFIGLGFRTRDDPMRRDVRANMHAYAAAENIGPFRYSFSHYPRMPFVDCDWQAQADTIELCYGAEHFNPEKHLDKAEYLLVFGADSQQAKKLLSPIIEKKQVHVVEQAGEWVLIKNDTYLRGR